MRFMMDEYFKDEPNMDRLNKGCSPSRRTSGTGANSSAAERPPSAGSTRTCVRQREQVASERIGRETVTYVSNIYKYYVAYKLLTEENARRERRGQDQTGKT